MTPTRPARMRRGCPHRTLRSVSLLTLVHGTRRPILAAAQTVNDIMARPKAHAAPATPTAIKPGTYFLSLTVENVRCFGPAQTLDLSDGHGRHAPWTIILGENGLGKTTLLTCLGFATFAVMDYAAHHKADLQEQLERMDSIIGLLSRLPREAVASRNKIQAVLGVYNETTKVVNIDIIINKRIVSIDGRTREPIVPPLSMFYYGANRRMPQHKGFAADDDSIRVFLDDNAAVWDLRDPEDWIMRADYNAHLGGPDAKRFAAFAKRVQDALVSILPEVADIRIRAAEEPGGSPRVEAQTPDGWIPLRRLGFGYQSQIAWLVDFASRMFERYPDSPDPLTEPAVVLLDEIDLHMHPRWQRQIIGYLTERCPNTQFIVTAHSPLIVQAAAKANIVLLRREGDHVAIDNDPEVLRNWRVDQILTSELFGLESARPPQIEEPLKERREILAKPKLTRTDEKRLAELERAIGELPAGETAEDSRAMELIRRAAAKLSSDA